MPELPNPAPPNPKLPNPKKTPDLRSPQAWGPMIGYIVVSLMMLWLWQDMYSAATIRTIDYSEFKAYLAKREVAECNIQETEINGRIVPKAANEKPNEKTSANKASAAETSADKTPAPTKSTGEKAPEKKSEKVSDTKAGSETKAETGTEVKPETPGEKNAGSSANSEKAPVSSSSAKSAAAAVRKPTPSLSNFGPSEWKIRNWLISWRPKGSRSKAFGLGFSQTCLFPGFCRWGSCFCSGCSCRGAWPARGRR